MRAADLALRLLDQVRQRAVAGPRFDPTKPVSGYFDERGGPGDPAYEEALAEVESDFPAWLDPGSVGAPTELARDGDVVSFDSPRPVGQAPVDRVALRLHAAPGTRRTVGVLFHHWVCADSWKAVDFLLAPLVARLPVATMVAPHHFSRRSPGRRPGEGMINANPLALLEGMRQWQADHAACVELLRRDHGFERVVVLGYSLGGYCSLLARLFGERLPLGALCVTNHYALGVHEGSATRGLVPRLAEAGFTRESFTRATRVLHLTRWAERIGGEGVTWIRARDDRIEPGHSLDEAEEALRPERRVELPGGHATVAVFRKRIAAEVARLASGS